MINEYLFEDDNCIKNYLIYYIWLDGKNNLRTKLKVQNELKFDDWNADGSSTFQANLEDSEIILKVVKYVKINPKYFNITKVYDDKHEIYIALCEVYDRDYFPHITNSRNNAQQIFDNFENKEIMFGLEQEYYIINPKTKTPESNVYNLIECNEIEHQDYHYCYTGIEETFGRKIAEHHLYACLDCGLNISGINSEVGPCQWEFQIGPVIGIDATDQLIIAKFLLLKIAEMYGYQINFKPKPFSNINGSGCHINVSTKSMRDENGLEYIREALSKLSKVSSETIQIYGEENKERLNGSCETAQWEKFSVSFGGRNASIRINNETTKQRKGYFEDRRPGSNTDLYRATSHILYTLST